MAASVFLIIWGTATQADFWEVSRGGDEGYYWGWVEADDGHLRFSCRGNTFGDTSPDILLPGLGPFSMALLLRDAAVGINPDVPLDNATQSRSDIVISVDGTGYRLPTVPRRFVETEGFYWIAFLSMNDALITDLTDGVELLAVATDESITTSYQSDGDLAEALGRITQYCLDQLGRVGEVPPWAHASAPTVVPETTPQSTSDAWSVRMFDNGAWFEGAIVGDETDVVFSCGGLSAGGLPMPHSDEATTTQPYTFYLDFWSRDLPRADLEGRLNAALVIDGARYVLPALNWNAMNENWRHWLSFGDPLISALIEAETLALEIAGVLHTNYAVDGLSEALIEFTRFCDERWQIIESPLPDLAAEAVSALRQAYPSVGIEDPTPMLAAAWQEVFQVCEGRFAVPHGLALHEGDFDSDGLADTVLDWGGVTCLEGFHAGRTGAGMCGARNCNIQLFASSTFPTTGRPAGILGVGSRIVSGAPDVLVTNVTPSMVCEAGTLGCGTRWRWTGTGLEPAE